MSDILQRIVRGQARGDRRRPSADAALADLHELARWRSPRRARFAAAMRAKVARGDAAVIAEIKKASPSKGVLREQLRPGRDRRELRAKHGAACLSVLTDVQFFQGHEDFLESRRAPRARCR